MKNELWGLYKPYQEEDSHIFRCYKCRKQITDDIQFTVHIMTKKNLEMRHYHIDCAPKNKLNYILSRVKHSKRVKEK